MERSEINVDWIFLYIALHLQKLRHCQGCKPSSHKYYSEWQRLSNSLTLR